MDETRALLEIELEVSRLRTRLLEEKLGQPPSPTKGLQTRTPRKPRLGRAPRPLTELEQARVSPLAQRRAQQILEEKGIQR